MEISKLDQFVYLSYLNGFLLFLWFIGSIYVGEKACKKLVSQKFLDRIRVTFFAPFEIFVSKQELEQVGEWKKWLMYLNMVLVIFVFTSLLTNRTGLQLIIESQDSLIEAKDRIIKIQKNKLKDAGLLIDFTEEKVIDIAEKKFVEIYGDQVLKQKPFVAKLDKNTWYVKGTLHCPPHQVCMGGVAEAEISAVDGAVIRITHGK